MSDEQLDAREGDVLVVSYPEVTIPLPTKYANLKVGGLIYTRRLVSRESPAAQYELVYAFLKRMAEKDAREKVRIWTAELAAANQRPSQPKPVGR